MPKRASRKHCMRASRWAEVSVSWTAGDRVIDGLSVGLAAFELGVAEVGGRCKKQYDGEVAARSVHEDYQNFLPVSITLGSDPLRGGYFLIPC